MSTEADPARPAAHAWLLAPLLLLAAGPAVAPSLPYGPRSLLIPGSALIGAGAVVLLWTVFVWPSLRGARRVGGTATAGALILLLAGPFLAGLGRLGGTSSGDLLGVGGVLAAGILVTGLYLAGPGVDRTRDRWFAAAVALVFFAAPLTNYALNEFAGVTGDVGYRVSPILTVRRIVLDLPDADPAPFYWVCLAAAAGMLGPRLLRRSAPLAGLLLLASVARGDTPEVKPLLGRFYVPDRPVPLLVTGGKAGERTWLRVPGRGRFGGETSSRGSILRVPLPRSPQGLEVRFGDVGEWLPVEADLEPVGPEKLWVVCIREVPEGVRSEAKIAAGRIPPPDLQPGFWPLGPDGFVDPYREAVDFAPFRDRIFHELPPSLTEALLEVRSPLRRIWEEGGDLKELRRLFEADTRATDDGAALTALALLAGFAVAAAGAARFLRSSRVLLPGILVLAAGTAVAVLTACPRPQDSRSSSIVVEDGPLAWEIRRYRAARDTVIQERHVICPVVLGEGPEVEVVCHRIGLVRTLDLTLRAHDTRYLIAHVKRPEGRLEPKLIIGPEGLSLPGGEAMSPSEFLLGPPGRAFLETTAAGTAVRKLLRLDALELPRRRYGVGIEALPGKPVHVQIFRLDE